MTPQPTDKLDAATAVVVNGPADDPHVDRADRKAERQQTSHGWLEPDAVKVARPVLRGAGRRKALGLPDSSAR
jgi:hypothetical protein